MQHFSTEQVNPTNRLGYWAELVDRFFGKVGVDSRTPEQFNGEVTYAQSGPISAFDFKATSHAVHNPPQPVPSIYILSTFDGEYGVSQHGNHDVMKPRGFVVLDNMHDFDLTVPDATHACALNIPLCVAPRDLVHTLNATGLPIDGTEGMGAVTAEFIRALALQAPRLEESETKRLLACLVDLLNSAALAKTDKTFWPMSRHRVFQVQKIRLYIESQLREPDLSPEKIARDHGISRRYLSKLFEDDGTTVMRHVWSRRLDRCRCDLADPQMSDKTITEIAHRWGFSSSSHFSRAFKEQFGITPGAARLDSQALTA